MIDYTEHFGFLWTGMKSSISIGADEGILVIEFAGNSAEKVN